jgi:hypothetical protein
MIFVTLLALFVSVGAGTLVAIVSIFWHSWRKPWRTLGFRLLLSLLPIAALIWFTIRAFGPVDYTSERNLKEVYHMEIGEYPASDVTQIRCRQTAFADSGETWLSFRASPQTIDKLINRFTSTDAASFAQAGYAPDAPEWWKPEADGISTFFRAENLSRSFSSSWAYLGVDQHRSIVYLQLNCWD